MKKLFFLIMIMISTVTYSQIIQRQKPVVCSDLSELTNSLKMNYGEKLELLVTNQMYRDFVTNIAMYRNKETGSWTMIEYGENFQGEGCIIGSGKDTTS